MNNEQHLISRAGEQHRSNPERYFHVMTQGWYVFTREGIQGPFVDKPRAKAYLEEHVKESQAEKDPSESWRL
jgi:hypothetical protein